MPAAFQVEKRLPDIFPGEVIEVPVDVRDPPRLQQQVCREEPVRVGLANYNKNYASIQADNRHPEVNRATSGVYPPGSTFKMVTAIAGLEEGIISGDTYVTCTGTYEYGGQTFRCISLA